MNKTFSHSYNDIITLENLLLAWKEFVKGKRNKKDVQEFELNLMDNIISLHDDLVNGKYVHSKYESFNISDPKPRIIHKALVRDRLLHHLIHMNLYPFFDRTFIPDSYSCRVGKGIHKSLNQFRNYANKVSKSNTRICWVLKCDINKFFASIDQRVLKGILSKYIEDERLLNLLYMLIDSFSITDGRGLPLGNLTSQLLTNIYMNEFDQFVKHNLKVRYYIRYADDFVFLDSNRGYLERLIPEINELLNNKLKLQIHPNKISIKTFASGVDFLGWIHFSDHRVLRSTTKRRMIKKLGEDEVPEETMQSYLGLILHGNSHKLKSTSIFPLIC